MGSFPVPKLPFLGPLPRHARHLGLYGTLESPDTAYMGGKLSVEVTKLEPIRTGDNETSQQSPSLHPSHY